MAEQPIPADNKPIFVIGAGSWGTALALVLARNGNIVQLWDSDKDHIQSLINDLCNNRHLPGISFPENLHPVTDFMEDSKNIVDVLVVVPCEALEEILIRLKRYDLKNPRICLASKGLEPNALSLNHEIVNRILGDLPVAILSGPSFAKEVALGLPTAVILASLDTHISLYFSELFHSEMFRIYTHNDVIGVQIGGAAKNVMAIAAGIADGLEFGANTRSALITRGLAEIMRLGVAMGGRSETFMGLAGLGDLVLTCTDNQSRNRRFGIALAEGKSSDKARSEIGQVVEGIRTAGTIVKLAKHYNIEMPISVQVKKVIDGEISAQEAVQLLLARERKSELE